MDKCHDCERIFDADADPDCYIEVGNMRSQTQTICVCEFCRELRQEEADRNQEQANRSDEALQAKIDALPKSFWDGEDDDYFYEKQRDKLEPP